MANIPITNNQHTNKPVIVFMGYGALEALVKKYAKGYENIYFHPAVSPDVLLDYTSSADFGISTIEDSCLSYRYCLPNKMFEYMMANLPVLISNLPEMRRVVEQYEIGIVIEKNNIQGVQEAIKKAIRLDRHTVIRNLQKAKMIYRWEHQEDNLIALYKGLNGE